MIARAGQASAAFEDHLVGAFADDLGDVVQREDPGGDLDAVAVRAAGALVDLGDVAHVAPLLLVVFLVCARSISLRSRGNARGSSTSERAHGRPRACRRRRSSRSAGRPSTVASSAIGMADVLDAQPVLVAPEARQRRRARARSPSIARPPAAPWRAAAPSARVRRCSPDAVVVASSDVAGGEDVRERRSAGAVGDTPSVASRCLRAIRSRGDADADHDGVAGEPAAAAQVKLLDPPLPRAPSSLSRACTSTPSSRASASNQRPTSGRAPDERSWQRLDDRHLERRPRGRWRRPPGR